MKKYKLSHFYFALLIIVNLLIICNIHSFSQNKGQTDEQTYKPQKKVKLEKKTLQSGLSILIPKDFTEMTDDDLARKYPSYLKPTLIYTDPNREIDMSFNFTINNWGEKNIALLKRFYKSTFLNLFGGKITFYQDTVLQIDERNYAILEFSSETENKESFKKLAPIRNYSYMAYTVLNHSILVFNFTCPEKYRIQWQKNADKIIKSISISVEKLNVKDAERKSLMKKRGKTPKEILKEMNTKTEVKPEAKPAEGK